MVLTSLLFSVLLLQIYFTFLIKYCLNKIFNKSPGFALNYWLSLCLVTVK